MPAGQRDLFGRVTVSVNEYMPLMAVARMDSLIGEDEVRAESDAAVRCRTGAVTSRAETGPA